MRASIKWLKDYVQFDETPEEIAEKLTMAGVAVEAIEYLGENIEGVVTGKIVSVKHHPNADKLLICKIEIEKTVLEVVTGAQNVSAGQIVPVALNGAKLPGGKEIFDTDFRGVLSQGMLCSASELNLDPKLLHPAAKEGIYVLPEDTPVGVDVKEALGLDDVVLEFELTANRADCFCMLGLAREISVLTGNPLKKPMLNLREEGKDQAANLIKISIEDPHMCSRFTARVLQDIKVGPSPAWLRHRVEAAGMRSISNVVDVANFVMLELGLPMHTYDYNMLSRQQIMARQARPGERLLTLDGEKRQLTPDMLVIADAIQAVGLAGVMGGLATEITPQTKTVLVEAAAFNGVSIRRTSRALGLRSEASGRFERGVDRADVTRALDRLAQLLEEMGACKVCPGIVDVYPGVSLPKQITFTAEQINKHLGTDILQSVMIDILRRLEFTIEKSGDQVTVTAPTWRSDVTGIADISEEVARIHGFDKIIATTPQGYMMQGKQSKAQDLLDNIRNILSGNGFDEVMSFSFTNPAALDKLNLPTDDPLRKTIQVLNPITDDFPLLRTTLLGGVLETIGRNLARKNEDMCIYELGAVYLPVALPLTELPEEPQMLCGAMLGKRYGLAWNRPRDMVDFYDAKGVVEILLDGLGIKDYEVVSGQNVSMHPGKTGFFVKDREILGSVGEVHPQVLDAFGLTRKVYAFELNVSQLLKHVKISSRYTPLPKFPAIVRDLSITLPIKTSVEEVLDEIRVNSGEWLETVTLFDVYTGGQVEEGMRSLAFSLTFRSPDRTLTDEEINECHGKIVDYLDKKMAAKLRK
ncbi:MAG: pheT [Firmicutes bacterium]|nr:pheT [Bacillota bacterium]